MAEATEKKRKKKDANNSVGRPDKFPDIGELQRKIDEYFESCYEEVWRKMIDKETGEFTGEWEPVLDRHGKVVTQQVRPFTISGLALALGTSRKVLLEYEKRDDEFSNTIKKAKSVCEQFAEESLFTSKNTAGVIFNLKNNYDWVDKQEQQLTANVTMSYEEQLEDLIK